jgi:hypothetical protein
MAKLYDSLSFLNAFDLIVRRGLNSSNPSDTMVEILKSKATKTAMEGIIMNPTIPDLAIRFNRIFEQVPCQKKFRMRVGHVTHGIVTVNLVNEGRMEVLSMFRWLESLF